MSLNFAVAVLPNTDSAALASEASAGLSFDEASGTAHPGPAVAQHGPHTLVVDPTMQILATPTFVERASAAIVGLSGVSDVYVLQVLGETPRLRVLAEGEVVEDEGSPLEAESVLAEHDFPEDGHLALFCRIAGLDESELNRLEWRPLADEHLL